MSEPIYLGVARTLREEIVGGTHLIGQMLPTETELAGRFAVSRQTARAALRVLREERLVVSRQGSGTMVASPSSSDAFRLEANSINDLVAYAADMYTEIRAVQVERVIGRAASRLGVASGQDWLVVRGIARFKKRQVPVCWSEYYIHRDFAAIGRLLPRNSGPIFLLIEDACGVTIAEMDQTITAATLSRTIAEELRAGAGDPSIEVRRTYRTASGQLAQISLHAHPAVRFQQTIKMRRLRN